MTNRFVILLIDAILQGFGWATGIIVALALFEKLGLTHGWL